MWDDERLLEAWRDGNTDAGDQLVRAHYDSLRRFFDLRVPAVAEDLVQQTFLAAVEGHERVRNGESFKAYLFGIARRRLFRHLRNEDRFDRMVQFRQAQGPPSILSPSGVVSLRQEHRLLLRALDELPVDSQLILQLHYWEGMKTADIGAVLEVPTSTVTTRLSRARQRLYDEIATMRVRAAVRDSLLSDLESWTRSIAAVKTPAV